MKPSLIRTADIQAPVFGKIKLKNNSRNLLNTIFNFFKTNKLNSINHSFNKNTMLLLVQNDKAIPPFY
jgi:hypothetical protein